MESIFIEVNSDNLKAVVGEIYHVPNTNEVTSINMYSQIISKLQNYKNDIIIGTDQHVDYIKIDQLNGIINNEVQEKTVIIPASRIIRDPWITTGLITSSRKLNKLYKMKIGKDKNHPNSTKYSEYRNAYNSLKRKAKSTFYN